MPLVVNTLVKLDIEDDPCLNGPFELNGYEDGRNAIFQHGCVGIVTETSNASNASNASIQDGWDIRVHWVHTCPNHKQYRYKGSWHDSDILWETGNWGNTRETDN